MKNEKPKEILQEILNEILDFTGQKLSDDVALLAVRRT